MRWQATERGHVKESNLPFEGFLEALCRLASMKSLPTDEEIERAKCRDAAEYLEKLHDYDIAKYNDLMESRATPWGETPIQPIERCVAHLLCIIIRAIERRCGSGAGNGELDSRECSKFWRLAGNA